MHLLDLAPGTLVLLVGPAGSGKSTWARQHARPTQIVSSDAFRAMLSDDASDPDATADAFRVLHAVVRGRLRRGRTTVVDATNLTDGARRPLLALAGRFGRPVVAVAFTAPLERVLAQNLGRTERVVPEDVVRHHHRSMPAALAALRDAGVRVVEVEPDPEE